MRNNQDVAFQGSCDGGDICMYVGVGSTLPATELPISKVIKQDITSQNDDG